MSEIKEFKRTNINDDDIFIAIIPFIHPKDKSPKSKHDTPSAYVFAKDTTSLNRYNHQITNGYIKNNVLHLSVFQAIKADFSKSYNFRSIKPIDFAFVHKIWSDISTYGIRHHLNNLNHIELKIDNNMFKFCNTYNITNIHDSELYDNALKELGSGLNSFMYSKSALNSSSLLNLKSIRDRITEMISSKKGFTDKFIQDDLLKAKTNIQSAIYQKKHLDFQKKLETSKN